MLIQIHIFLFLDFTRGDLHISQLKIIHIFHFYSHFINILGIDWLN